MPTSACPFRSAPQMTEQRQRRMMSAFARRRPGVPLERVRSDLSLVAARMAEAHPEFYPKSDGFSVSTTPLREALTVRFRPTLVILLGTAGFVLLIVCASVANLLVARLIRRNRELAVRTALGAGRWRVFRQLVTESTMLALAGGVVGLALAWIGLDLLVAYAARFSPRAAEVTIDWRVLLFTLGVSVATGVVFGAIPALTRDNEALPVLRGGGARVAGGRHTVRTALVVAQVAVSFMLLIGAGLMLRSLMKLQQVDPGFRVEQVLTARMDLNFTKYRNPAERAAFIEKVLQRLEAEPGITSAAVSATFPLNDGGVFTGTFGVEGRPVAAGLPQPRAQFMLASPAYFRTLGIPLLRGRLFTPQDNVRAPQRVVAISNAVARRYWKDDDPIGKRLTFDNGQNWSTIVGVVGDARQQLELEAADTVYAPILQTGQLSTTWLIRTDAPAGMTRQVREAVREIDPDQPIDRFRTLEEVRTAAVAPWRLTARLLGTFALLALVITALGIFGVIAFSVNQRVQEFGIRMALGAERGEIISMVLRQGMRLVVLGLAIGTAGALLLTGWLANLLFGITPTDTATFASVSLLLLVVAMLACFVPARRAASVEPAAALRAV